jgi:redox-sensitive bicupin YhaK (pirin superfamily)
MTEALLTPGVDVRRAADRGTTALSWLDSRHSFSFGRHYDPTNTHHGVLLANNDDVVHPGAGFETHPHRDMEIVTWVLSGSLVHQDSTGHRCHLPRPGSADERGHRHSVRCCVDGAFASSRAGRLQGERHTEPVHFVQMWVVPDESGVEPAYEQREIDAELLPGALVPVASGMKGHGDSAIRIRNRHAALHAARLEPGGSVQLPDAPYVHLFTARGEVELEGAGPLAAGDAVRLTGVGGQRVMATGSAEVLLWEMHAGLAG